MSITGLQGSTTVHLKSINALDQACQDLHQSLPLQHNGWALVPVLKKTIMPHKPPHAKTTAPTRTKRTVAPRAVPAPVTVPLGFARVQAGMKLERNDIANMPLDDKYAVLKTVDAGDGAKGGMNAGVFVVRKKSTKELFIQKNFKFDQGDHFLIELVKKEIIIMRMLKCNSLVSRGSAVNRPDDGSNFPADRTGCRFNMSTVSCRTTPSRRLCTVSFPGTCKLLPLGAS